MAANGDNLYLGSVKSYLGSYGVNRRGFRGIAAESKKSVADQEREYNQYRIFNDPDVRNGVIEQARGRYKYQRSSIRIVLFVGHFKNGEQEIIQTHLSSMNDNGVKFEVIALDEIIEGLLEESQNSTYINDPVIMTVKALGAAGKLSKNEG